jgi:4-amino-4-deoxy-L-arabinose transferase-like glycosyltransferase
VRSGLRIAISLFALASTVRLAYLFVSPPPFQDFYWDLAGNWLQHGSLAIDAAKTTEFEPLYPLFLAAARWIARDHVQAVQAMQVLVAAAGGVLLFRLAEALTGRRRVGVLSGLLYACYPLLIRHSADAVEAALLTTILIAFAYAFVVAKTRRGAAAAGVLLGAAILTRTAVLPLLPLSLAAMAADGRRRAAIGLALAAIVVAPYFLRNHALNGSLLPTRGGRNLFIANCEYVVLPEYGPDILSGFAQTILEREGLDRQPPSPALERQQDILFRRFALAGMTRRPLHTLWLKLENVWYFFSPRLVPYHEPTSETRIVLGAGGAFSVENSPPRSGFNQWSYSVPYAFVVLFAVVGLRSRRGRLGRDAILWCIVMTFVVVHAVYFPATRYRVPMEFVLLFYAAVGLDVGAEPVLRRWRPRWAHTRGGVAELPI